jgi:hypothetical protein
VRALRRRGEERRGEKRERLVNILVSRDREREREIVTQ